MEHYQEQIKLLTQQLLDNSANKIAKQMDQIKNQMITELKKGVQINENCNPLPNTKLKNKKSIIPDIFINPDPQAVPQINFKNVWNEFNNALNLKENEYIIFDKYGRYCTHMFMGRGINGHGCVAQSRIIICIVTNYSNVYWSDIVLAHSSQYFPYYLQTNCTIQPKSKNHISNVILDDIYFDILNQTIVLNTPLTGIYVDDQPAEYTVNNYFNDVYNNIISILKINEKNYTKLLTHLDTQQKYEKQTFTINLQQKYEKSLDTNKKLEDEIKKLKHEKEIVEQKLKNSIPVDLQCCICFGYTDKSQILIPCGHSSYCYECAKSIKECSICRIRIEKVQKIFK